MRRLRPRGVPRGDQSSERNPRPPWDSPGDPRYTFAMSDFDTETRLEQLSDGVFAGLVILMILTVTLSELMKLAEARLFRWKSSEAQ